MTRSGELLSAIDTTLVTGLNRLSSLSMDGMHITACVDERDGPWPMCLDKQCRQHQVSKVKQGCRHIISLTQMARWRISHTL